VTLPAETTALRRRGQSFPHPHALALPGWRLGDRLHDRLDPDVIGVQAVVTYADFIEVALMRAGRPVGGYRGHGRLLLVGGLAGLRARLTASARRPSSFRASAHGRHIPSVPPGRRSHQPGLPRQASTCSAPRGRPGSSVSDRRSSCSNPRPSSQGGSPGLPSSARR